jgi:hypothetical protein
MTTGIAIVGASVIAVAPVTVTPPKLPAAEVAVVDTVRSVTADVKLTALVNALIAAFPQAVASTVTLFTSTIPTTAQNLIAAGKFAHLPVLAVNTVILGGMAPVTPFLAALVQELPAPLGGADGLISESWKLAVLTPSVAVSTVLSLVAQVIDDGLSPTAAFLGAIDVLSTAIASTVESIGKILGTAGGALPFSAVAAPEVSSARVAAMDEPNVAPASLNSSSLKGSTVTVDTSALKTADGTEGTEPASTAESEAEPQASADDDVTPNGGTDLSDGNMAEPGTTNDESASEDNDGSASITENTTAEGASGGETATTTDTDTGSAEGSGGGGESSGNED